MLHYKFQTYNFDTLKSAVYYACFLKTKDCFILVCSVVLFLHWMHLGEGQTQRFFSMRTFSGSWWDQLEALLVIDSLGNQLKKLVQSVTHILKQTPDNNSIVSGFSPSNTCPDCAPHRALPKSPHALSPSAAWTRRGWPWEVAGRSLPCLHVLSQEPWYPGGGEAPC